MLYCEELGERQEGGGRMMLIIVSVGMGIQCICVEVRGCSEYLGERQEHGGQRADDDHCVCMRAVSVGRGIQCTFMGVRG